MENYIIKSRKGDTIVGSLAHELKKRKDLNYSRLCPDTHKVLVFDETGFMAGEYQTVEYAEKRFENRAVVFVICE